MSLFDRGAPFRERVRLGAEGTGLYAEVRTDRDGTSELFDEKSDPQLKAMLERVKMADAINVLILISTPDPVSPVDPRFKPIRPDKEAMILRDRMAGIPKPKKNLVFETVYATQPDQIQTEMVRHDPKILHFSGHGGGGDLAFEDLDGNASPVSGDTLARIVKAYGELECLVLHACYTDDIAQKCSVHVPHVVGSTDSISDDTAPRFTFMFYQALAAGRSYKQAFEMGRTEVAIVSNAEAAKYMLLSR